MDSGTRVVQRKGIRFKVINEDLKFQNNKTRKQKRISQTQINTNMKLLVGGDSFAEFPIIFMTMWKLKTT